MAEPIQAVTMPKWGLAMAEGMVTAWHVTEGAEVRAGDDLVDIETTKITNVFESPVSGVLRRQVAAAGETVPVGALIAVVAEAGVADADLDAFIARFEEEFASRASEAAEEAPAPATVEAGGRRLRYLRMGSGEGLPVLFLHGFGADLNGWLFNQPVLAESHDTIALDLPGHGGSTKDVGAGDVGALTAAVLDFLNALDVARAHVIGHSLGGAVALDLALNHGERVATLTLVCSAGLGPEISMDFIDGFVAAKRRKQLRPVLEMLVHDAHAIGRDMIEEVIKYKRIDGVDAALNRIAEGAFAGGHQALDLKGKLGDIAAPALVVWGAEDRIIPATHAEGLPVEWSVYVLEAAGHMVHMEKAGEVNALFAKHLNQ